MHIIIPTIQQTQSTTFLEQKVLVLYREQSVAMLEKRASQKVSPIQKLEAICEAALYPKEDAIPRGCVMVNTEHYFQTINLVSYNPQLIITRHKTALTQFNVALFYSSHARTMKLIFSLWRIVSCVYLVLFHCEDLERYAESIRYNTISWTEMNFV